MVQISISISDEEMAKYDELRLKTGLPVSRLIDLERRGFQVTPIQRE